MVRLTFGFGIALILLGVGGYVGTGRQSWTALIPAIAGGLLPAWQPGSELRNIIAADLKRYAEIRTRAKIQLE